MNIYTNRVRTRHRPVQGRGRRFHELRPLACRGLDIIVSAAAICFLAPVFLLLALVPIRDDSFGLSQLPQLFLVFAGEMSLFGARH